MFRMLYLLTALTFFCCKSESTNKAKTPLTNKEKADMFNWLVGDWIRTNDKEAFETKENWQKASDFSYKGNSQTLSDGEIKFQENMELVIESDNIYLIINIPGEGPTSFTLSQYNDNSFKAVNPQNPFPKFIEYKKEGDRLIAKIGNERKEILYDFIAAQ